MKASIQKKGAKFAFFQRSMVQRSTGLVENFKFLRFFFFGKFSWEKVFSKVLGRKLAFIYRLWKHRLKESENLHFFKFWSKISNFFILSVLGKIGWEKVFGDVLGRILACLDYENIKKKTSQNLHFSKGVSPWF